MPTITSKPGKKKRFFGLLAASLLLSNAALTPFAPLTRSAAASAESAALGLDSPRLVLKGGDHFMVLDPEGMVPAAPGSPYGLYQDDTRFISEWEFLLDGHHLHPLTAFTRDGFTGTFLYGNPPTAALPAQSMLIKRELVLNNGLSERLTLQSYIDKPLKFKMSLCFGADFNDMFEVRGQKRTRRGVAILAKAAGKYTTTYTGVDKSVVTSTIFFPQNAARKTEKITSEKISEADRARTEKMIDFDINLPARGKQVIELAVRNTTATAAHLAARASKDASGAVSDAGQDSLKNEAGQTFDQSKKAAELYLQDWQDSVANIKTDNTPLNKMIEQAGRDIFLLRQSTPKGPCLAAGLPWYAVAFGRDQAVTGLQMLTFAPGLSKQILQVLANYQGTKYDKFTEEQPGRILHELRLGEMARAREIPFIPFYGSIDATPLWLILLNRYVDTTGDIALARQLWPNVESALAYLERSTASTPGGFLFYGGSGKSFLSNQCWKDSGDSIMYKDGNLAKQPIAACEVQGYLYKTYADTARLASKLGHEDMAAKLTKKAALLKDNFEKYFWLNDQAFVALALDGEAKPCSVISSNPGQLLFTDILDKTRQDAVAKRLMQNDMYSGWGIRTLSAQEVKYNPMSYHDGTVWPHDNAIIIEGLAYTGHPSEANTVMAGLIDAGTSTSDFRLPELFCGFSRGEFDTPVPYPVSCAPQAWAAGSIFEMLKATLGINVSAREVTVSDPTLPPGVNALNVSNLTCGEKKVKLTFTRRKDSGDIDVQGAPADLVKVIR
ncbi:MAG: amylo-alpha-1,6-glucosidase [Cyanobacteria bacterium REEB67]|nr:amylo-alpha-1,6-glucosidase [Cyanobacteria bacterium REEB67]